MKEYKKLHLKNDDDSDRLIDHLNQGWELFREFTGWMILFRDKKVVASTVDYEITQLALTLVDKENPPKTVWECGVLREKATEIYMRSPVSPAEPEKPKDWFETLKEPMRSLALENLEKHPHMPNEAVGSMEDAISCGFLWAETSQGGQYWLGVSDAFKGEGKYSHGDKYTKGYELAKACAPDGWEQQGAGE